MKSSKQVGSTNSSAVRGQMLMVKPFSFCMALTAKVTVSISLGKGLRRQLSKFIRSIYKLTFKAAIRGQR